MGAACRESQGTIRGLEILALSPDIEGRERGRGRRLGELLMANDVTNRVYLRKLALKNPKQLRSESLPAGEHVGVRGG